MSTPNLSFSPLVPRSVKIGKTPTIIILPHHNTKRFWRIREIVVLVGGFFGVLCGRLSLVG